MRAPAAPIAAGAASQENGSSVEIKAWGHHEPSGVGGSRKNGTPAGRCTRKAVGETKESTVRQRTQLIAHAAPRERCVGGIAHHEAGRPSAVAGSIAARIGTESTNARHRGAGGCVRSAGPGYRAAASKRLPHQRGMPWWPSWGAKGAEPPRTAERRLAGADQQIECGHSAWRKARRSVRSDAAVGTDDASSVPTAGTLASGTWVMASSAIAVIVRLGFTPTFAGTVEPSVISRFW